MDAGDIIHMLPAEYPDPIVRDGRVFFLQLDAFKAACVGGGDEPLSLQAKNARISAPVAQITAAFDKVPFFHSDLFCPDDLTFEDKARLVYLASEFNGQRKQALYQTFRAHWLQKNARCSPKGVRIRFMKDGVEDMVMAI